MSANYALKLRGPDDRPWLTLFLVALLVSMFVGCSTTGKATGGWTGPEPLTSQIRQQCLDIWLAELASQSADGPKPRPVRQFDRLRVRVAVGSSEPAADHLAETVRRPDGTYDMLFRAAAPARDLWRHESAHPYLIHHGMGSSHPQAFGKRHGLWNWRD